MSGDDFDSLFDDDIGINDLDFDDFDDTGDSSFLFDEKPPPQPELDAVEDTEANSDLAPLKSETSRSSRDFRPDMEAMLITAQSSMIIEGMKRQTLKDHTSKALPVYVEALNGINLYIKLLKRDPENYRKLEPVINSDIDCQEVERIAFSIYRSLYKEDPTTEPQKLTAFELFHERLELAYQKSLVSKAIIDIRKYYMKSGEVDTHQVTRLTRSNNSEFLEDMNRLSHVFTIAQELVKKGQAEITEGMKGREVRSFIIRSSRLLGFYFNTTGNNAAASYYTRIYDNYSRYNIMD